MKMKYSHKGNKNHLIWDGEESGITDGRYKLTCPHCNSSETYCLSNITTEKDTPDSLLKYLNTNKITKSGIYKNEVKKNVPAYITKNNCPSCKNEFWSIIGIIEIQPQRYNLYYKSTVFLLR